MTRLRLLLLVSLVAAIGAVGLELSSAAEATAPAHEHAAPTIDGDTIAGNYPGSGLIALKSWTPTTDYVLTCENYAGLLPMRPADLFVELVVPASGRVLVSASAMSAQSEPDLFEYWGIMLGDEVLAEGRVGFGDVQHRVTARFVIDGLEPGAMVRLDLAHRSDEGGSANLFLGPTYGPAVLEVWAA